MFDQCSFQRNGGQYELVLKCRLNFITPRILYFIIAVLTLLFFFLYINYYPTATIEKFVRQVRIESTTKKFVRQPHIESTMNRRITLARVLYLFLCESQDEVDTYAKIFPSATADVAFYCWRQNCESTHFSSSLDLFVTTWSGQERNRTLVQFNQSLLSDQENYYPIRSRVFIVNEQQLNLTRKMTWTTARNKLFELALAEEQKQGWRWAYMNFGDGDIHLVCPLAEQLLTGKKIVDYGGVDELVIATQFRSFVNLSGSSGEAQCFTLIDAFLFSVSPAAISVSGASVPMLFAGLLAQFVYHIDAMFNAIHRDALPFLLPYCPRYDSRSWWTSQAIFVYRSLCIYGHIIQFDGVTVARQSHRSYPRGGSPWAMDNDMNLVPSSLIKLQNYMQQGRFISPLVLHHYAGWKFELTSEQCRRNHTAMDLDTCLVHGENRTTTN